MSRMYASGSFDDLVIPECGQISYGDPHNLAFGTCTYPTSLRYGILLGRTSPRYGAIRRLWPNMMLTRCTGLKQHVHSCASASPERTDSAALQRYYMLVDGADRSTRVSECVMRLVGVATVQLASVLPCMGVSRSQQSTQSQHSIANVTCYVLSDCKIWHLHIVLAGSQTVRAPGSAEAAAYACCCANVAHMT